MNADTPVIFADGSDFFDALAQAYVCHKRGLFILAPSGSGKTYFIDKQTEKHWIDGDYLWPAANADLSSDDWSYDEVQVDEINAKSDVMTNEAKKLGFWIIGSSNKFIKPDAIVLPPWDTHVEYVQKRQKDSYDGGAKTDDLDGLKAHRKIIAKWTEHGVPQFETIQDAAVFCGKQTN